MKIKNHKLVGIDYKRSPNQSGIIKPKYLIIHYTAGRSFEASLKTLTRKSSKVSAHILIGRGGEVAQLVPFNKKSWHAGKSSWKDLNGMNAYTIGIELDNYGKLSRTADGGWQTYFGRKVDPSEVIVAKHKNGGKMHGWHTYSEAQMDKLEDIAEALFDKYNLEDVLGHEDIAPKRKSDPGPAFNMDSFRSIVLGRDDNTETEWEIQEPEVPDFVFYNPYNGKLA